MTRLAFVIPTLDQSGAERQLALLAMGLPRESYHVRVLALSRGGPWMTTLQDAGIPVELIGKRFRLDPMACLRLRARLRAFRPDVVQSFLFAANAMVRLPGITPAGSRIVVSERCVDSWKSGWQLRLDRRLAPRMDAMTANSESVAGFYAQHGIPRDRIHVIPNGVPDPPAERDREHLRRELSLPPDVRVVGCVGRLAVQKRLPDVIWAFQLLHQVVDNVRLVLIGDGPERGELLQLARSFGCHDKIIFTGHRPDAYRLMQGLDAFVLASDFEGMSNSLMDAMSLQVPVVVSNIPANCELVRDGTEGLVFETGRSPQLTMGLKRILTDSALAARLSSAAAERIRTQHRIEQLVERHCELYGRILASGRTR